ncbi:transketolase, chloroplastic [Tanacetum coccineum]
MTHVSIGLGDRGPYTSTCGTYSKVSRAMPNIFMLRCWNGNETRWCLQEFAVPQQKDVFSLVSQTKLPHLKWNYFRYSRERRLYMSDKFIEQQAGLILFGTGSDLELAVKDGDQ